jgi:hypothetical protein
MIGWQIRLPVFNRELNPCKEAVPRWGQILTFGVEASTGIARLKARLRAHNYRIGPTPRAKSCPQCVTLPLQTLSLLLDLCYNNHSIASSQ